MVKLLKPVRTDTCIFAILYGLHFAAVLMAKETVLTPISLVPGLLNPILISHEPSCLTFFSGGFGLVFALLGIVTAQEVAISRTITAPMLLSPRGNSIPITAPAKAWLAEIGSSI
ncbi:unnamed protein product [Fraxinus pennsylvanica]|uniref:Uncharacterized protein n=1 Tax=Fraxinus pennsylvanica TaxID=56036 RepID=A0AAD1ZH72_9LAMI|nr:unnamed protein product [Fraxinus pennsylvanica]